MPDLTTPMPMPMPQSSDVESLTRCTESPPMLAYWLAG